MVRRAAALLSGLLMAVFAMGVGSAFAAPVLLEHRHVTSDEHTRSSLSLSGDRVVYDSMRSGNRDIFLCDLESGTESRLTSQPAEQYWPDIEGDRITWFDRRNLTHKDWPVVSDTYYPDLYLYDLQLGYEWRETFEDGSRFKWNSPLERPRLSGDWIVFSNFEPVVESTDVFAFHIPSRAMRKTSTPSADYIVGISRDHSPSLWGDSMVFYNEAYVGHGYNQAAGADTASFGVAQPVLPFAPNRAGEPYEPLVWGDRVLGREYDPAGGGNDVAVYDYVSKARTVIAASSADERPIDLSGDRAVWEDRTAGAVYVADLRSGDMTAWRLPSDADPGTVCIDGDIVAWIDVSGDVCTARIEAAGAPVTRAIYEESVTSGPVEVTLEASCSASGVQETYYCIGGASADTLPWVRYTSPFTVSAEGVTHIRFWSRSTSGVRETVREATVRIDKSVPSAIARAASAGQNGAETTNWDWPKSAPSDQWFTDWMRVYLGPQDSGGLAVTRYSVNGGSTVTTVGLEPLEFPAGTDGRFRIDYDCVDAAGHVGTARTGYLNFDVQAPVTTCDKESGWRTSDYTVSLDATDSASGVAVTKYIWSWDGNSWGIPATYTAPIPVNTDGKRWLKYWSVDKAGRVESATVRWFGLDRQVPTTDDDVTDGWHRYNCTFKLPATDPAGGSGLAATYYSINGRAPVSLPFYYAQMITEEGDNTVEYWSVDVAGNREATKSVSVKVDSTGPTVSSNAPDVWPAEPYLVSIEASDNLSGISGVTYSISYWNGGSTGTMAYTGPFYVTGPARITMSATDGAGMTGTTIEPATYGIDHTPSNDFGGCTSCHQQQMDAEHSARGFGCGTCHQPDYRRHEPMQCASPTCHPGPIPGFKTYMPGRAQHTGCETCHQPWTPPGYLGHDPAACSMCHGSFDGPRVYEPERWWFPHSGCETCHGNPVPWTPVQRSMKLDNRACEGCHEPAQIHPDQYASHQSTQDLSGCSCHQSNLTQIQGHVDCALCHGSPVAGVQSAISGGRTDCVACHATTDHVAIHVSATSSGCFGGSGCHPASKNLADVHDLYAGPGSEHEQYATSCALCHENPAVDTTTSGTRCTPACHDGSTHDGRNAKHATTAASASCTAKCHSADILTVHGAYADLERCGTCHQRKDIWSMNGDCANCHEGHTHPAAAIVGRQAGDGHLCTECHSTDILVEHGKSTSSTNADPCAACHAPGGPREQMGGAWDGSCDTPACHGPVSDQPIHANYCIGCHEKGNPDFAVAETDFSAPGADRTKCAACHGPGITDLGRYKVGRKWFGVRHLSHNATEECASCHFWSSRRGEFYTHSVVTSYGAFATAESTRATPARAHAVHVVGSWPKDNDFAPTIYCSNCHQPAACASCHPTANMPLEHAGHGGTAKVTVSVAPGATNYAGAKVVAAETRSCTAAACHGAGAAQTPTCSSCHADRAAKHW